jgi:hypothetical protein
VAWLKISRLLVGFGVAVILSACASNGRPGDKLARECFSSTEWSGWRASPDSKSIYIRVGVNRTFRIDLASACPELQEPDAHLVTKIHGSPWICDPLDLDLKVSVGHGFRTACFVSDITPLSADEAAALPKDLRP